MSSLFLFKMSCTPLSFSMPGHDSEGPAAFPGTSSVEAMRRKLTGCAMLEAGDCGLHDAMPSVGPVRRIWMDLADSQ